MATEPTKASCYVLSNEAVRRAINKLSIHSVHEHFAGYLALLLAEREEKGRLHRSRWIKDFHQQFLIVPGLAETAPYFSPLRRAENYEMRPFNKNVAGSYAPSSLRPEGAFLAAIEVSGRGQGVTYALKNGHANVVARFMLNGKRIQAIALAIYLFRDFGFEQKQIGKVLDTFREKFALRQADDDEAESFDTLFSEELVGFSNEDLVEFLLEAD